MFRLIFRFVVLFCEECRALTNLVGNACAVVVVAKWDKALNKDTFDQTMKNQTQIPKIVSE